MSAAEARKPPIPTVRQDIRYAPYRDLAITYEGYSENIPVRAPDVSTSGMFINTSRRFPEGAVIKVRFRLRRSGHEVHVRAEVRHCVAGVGIGVQFLEISDEDRQAILDEIQVDEPLPAPNSTET